YTYDNANRLSTVTAGSISTTLNYNSDSELTTSKAGSATTTYGFDAEGDRTSVAPAVGAATTYSYDQADRLTGVSRTGLSASYAYNGAGLRMSKTVNGTTEQYSWDQSGSVPLLIQDGATSFIYGPGGMTLEQIDGSGNPTYYLHDWQGSTLGMVNSSGAVVVSYSYDAYGNLTSSSGTVSTPLLFQGQYRDSETGFYYLQARYYDPATGQFLTRDPMAAGTGAPYVFAADDPVNGADPTGDLYAPAESGSGSRNVDSSPSPSEPGAEGRFLPAAPSPSSHSTRTVSKHSSSGCSGIFCGFTSFLGDAVNAVKHNIGTIASVAAIVTCVGTALTVIGLGACAVMQAAALGLRAYQRNETEGFHQALTGDIEDATITTLTFGFVGIPTAAGVSAIAGAAGNGAAIGFGASMSLSDMISTGEFAWQNH
ncbi:MAG: RHS repeat-associated core domain-containing protein, partial [Candidatus Dormiibacterota bacterium]